MNKREFTFSDGKSNKFWNIEIGESEFSVSYGRTGTNGQSAAKTFGSDDETRKAADKLIAEKVKKGYVETVAGASAAPAKIVAAAPAKKEVAPVEMAETTPVEVVEETPALPANLADLDADAPRDLGLEPDDYLWATWRPRIVQTRSNREPPAFDKDAALKRLEKVPSRAAYNDWEWNRAKLAPTLGRAEAQFWLWAMTTPMRYDYRNHQNIFKTEYLPTLAKMDFDGQVSAKTVIERFKKNNASVLRQMASLVVFVMAQLFEPLEILDIGLAVDEFGRANTDKNRYYNSTFADNFIQGFRQYLLPFLSDTQRQSARERLQPEIGSDKWPQQENEAAAMPFFLAAQLGMRDELFALIRTWKDDRFLAEGSYYMWNAQHLVFGLGDAAQIEATMRRVKLYLTTDEYIRAWLANTEFGALDYIRESILHLQGQQYANSTKEAIEALSAEFARVKAPEVAPEMLHLLLESKAPRPARDWLEGNPAHAIRGLLPVAAGRGKLAEAAVEQLRAFKRRGAQNAIESAAQNLPADELARVQSAVIGWTEKTFEPLTEAELPDAVRDAIAGDKKLKPTQSWAGAADLPPITMGDKRLSDAHIELLLSALRKPGHLLVRAVKEGADRASADAFAWKLFERWLSEGAPSKEKWAMLALGALGGDVSALKLTPLIRAWPGEAQHARAVAGLEVLRAIGSDTALMQINGIAQKVKFKGLQAKAVEAMEGIALDRGFSRAQLEDRVVPTLDLDERGTRIFDFGPRQFQMVLSADMKPSVREIGDAKAKAKPNLPAPNSKDDEVKSADALADWKLLKKQLSESIKIQSFRLEQAMVCGRAWTIEEFEMLLARHPLMQNLARLLVWEAASGNRRALFRLTEDGTYADQSDETFDLQRGEWAHVGIVHPLNLTEDERAAWSEVFGDYEIVPPFPQLGRATYALQNDEVGGKLIARFDKVAIAPETLNFGLEKLGWQVENLHDHGDYYEHFKSFAAAGVRACVHYEPGLFKGYREGWEPQTIVRAFFLPDDYQAKTWDDADEKQALPLAEVEAVALSEVLKELSELAARGTVKA